MAKTFTEPAAFLAEAREALAEFEKAKARQAELDLQEKREAKTLASEKKAVEDTVNGTVKKRSDELAAGYDGEIQRLQDAVKKIRGKREKAKQQGIRERIEAQTEPYREENREMNAKIKAMFRQNHVPAFCNSLLFYSLYFPRSVKEILTMLAVFLLCCAAVPCGIFWLLPQRKPWQLILIYLGVIIVFGGLYLAVGNMTKDAHRDVLVQAGQVRRAMAKNRRKMHSVARGIRREKTEDHYDLSRFDAEIAQKEKEREELLKKKEEAMAVFLSTTKPAIIEEIVSGSQERITQMEEGHEQTVKSLEEIAGYIKTASLALCDDYESYIGKEFMQEDRLNALIAILENGQASSISEAEMRFREQNTARK